MSRPWVFWTAVALVILAFTGGVFALLAFVWAVEVPKAILGALLVTFIGWSLFKHEAEAEPLKMRESVWLDVDGDKE